MTDQAPGTRDELGSVVARLLDPADPNAARLWDHLARFCFFDRPLPMSTKAMQRSEGRREVFLELTRLASRPLRMVRE
jgi:hypothetical protein